jgi:hypothetical protein
MCMPLLRSLPTSDGASAAVNEARGNILDEVADLEGNW